MPPFLPCLMLQSAVYVENLNEWQKQKETTKGQNYIKSDSIKSEP